SAHIDFANARPMPMPMAKGAGPSPAKAMARALDPLQVLGLPGGEDGDVGTGEQNPVQLVAPKDIPQDAGIEPDEYGTSVQPFTTSQGNASGDLTGDC